VGAPESARERVLSTASHLFCSRGPGAVGVDEVIARAGVAKATLYTDSPSEEALVLAHLDRVDRSWREQRPPRAPTPTSAGARSSTPPRRAGWARVADPARRVRETAALLVDRLLPTV
jgi:AcrR family transcriptional regulator